MRVTLEGRPCRHNRLGPIVGREESYELGRCGKIGGRELVFGVGWCVHGSHLEQGGRRGNGMVQVLWRQLGLSRFDRHSEERRGDAGVEQ